MFYILLFYLDLRKNYKQKDKIRFEYMVKKISRNTVKVVRNIVMRTRNKQVCCIDFSKNDVSKTFIKVDIMFRESVR